MCPIDERPEVVGPTVQARWRVEIDAVVAPTETTWKFGNRHQLEQRDAGRAQLRQLAHRALVRARLRERPDVHLIDDLPAQAHARPCAIGPRELARIDELRRAVRAFGLEARD